MPSAEPDLDASGGGSRWVTEQVALADTVLVAHHRHGAGPVIVLEAGLGLPGSFWRDVCADLPSASAVLYYDRAGLGRSAPGVGPRSGANQAQELRALLSRLALPPPYVLVGHSAGAFIARIFTAAHPDEVAGIVLIDPAHEDEPARPVSEYFLNAALRLLSVLAGTRARGWLFRLAHLAVGRRWAPLDDRRLWLFAQMSRPEQLTGLLRENQAHPQTITQVRRAAGAGTIPDIPVRVLSASPASRRRLWSVRRSRLDRGIARHAALAASVPRGLHTLAAGASHLIPLDAPRLVADLIAAVAGAS
jgi:pimeloyl-ACP methyl ester carboxylesterase